MRLILTSNGLGREPQRLPYLVSEDSRTALVIPNASSREVEEAKQEELEDLGFTVQTLDLEDYYESRNDELTRRLGEAGLIWALDGDRSRLAEAMHLSGFIQIAAPLIKANRITYGGEGAGAEVAGDETCLGLYDLPIVTRVGSKESKARIPEGHPYHPLPEGSTLVLRNGKQFYIPPKDHDNTGD